MPGLPENEMEGRMGRLLQGGVLVSGLVMITGGALYLSREGKGTISYRTFHAVDPRLKTIAGIIQGVGAINPAAIIQLGVLLMIATPVLRVVFAIFGFSLQRDWLYTLISALVLGLVTYGLISGA